MPTLVFNFDSATPGGMPSGWSSTMTNTGEAPRWEVMKDATAPTPPYVFAQVSRDATDARFPLAILDKPYFQNGEISVRLKPVYGKEDQAGGLVWRYRDPSDYYLVRANALENNVVLYKVEHGKRTPLAPKGMPANAYAVKHPVPLNGWSILKVTFKGPVFSVYFNHRRLFQVEDRSFPGAGKVGLWTKADSVTYFDDFRVAQK
jgi:hypothetical protein